MRRVASESRAEFSASGDGNGDSRVSAAILVLGGLWPSASSVEPKLNSWAKGFSTVSRHPAVNRKLGEFQPLATAPKAIRADLGNLG
jgi:hypothetical protein